ncbi:phage tail tube protein [Subtercola endophyticus]|uniref:phage tail tube protein n=1 Tax=Subtercola endophyticus TaxID=2895559 RepID=UPI001E383B3A|nr:IPT/TIG domain-containing protein [Subtercola endophyticus]UFS59472.1 IPT/TIG domain-containing protein [Subtercola endophyticus]
MPSTALARRYAVDVSSDNTTWLRLAAVTDRNKQVSPNKIDSTTFDSNGWTNTEVTLQSWSLVTKVLRQPTAGVFDPAQELCRLTQGTFGDNIRLYVRTYDKFTGAEAQSGRAIVEWNEDKTGVPDLNSVAITFTGDGALTNLANITVPAQPLPVLVSASPSGAGLNGLVTVIGQYLTGPVVTTGVKIGGVNATSWNVVSDNAITFQVPAGSAGSAPILVTTAAGASNSLGYNRT